MGDGRWGGPDTGGGRLKYAFLDGEEEKGRKERGDGQNVSLEQGTRTNIGGGEKEGTKIISDGKHIIFKNRDRV